MPSDPRDVVRESIFRTVAGEIAARILQYDKANPAFKLDDLQGDDERAIFLAEVMELFSPERRAERTMKLNLLRGHSFALAERDEAEVVRQAQNDIRVFGDRLLAKFMQTDPQHCPLCPDRLLTNAVDVLLTPSGHVRGRAHGLCCAKLPERLELVADGTYQLKAVN